MVATTFPAAGPLPFGQGDVARGERFVGVLADLQPVLQQHDPRIGHGLLRRLDESAEIVVLERDHYVSFAHRGLPCHIGGAIPDRDSLLPQTPESLGKSLALDVRTGQEVRTPGRCHPLGG
jgi:hypothetical protein